MNFPTASFTIESIAMNGNQKTIADTYFFADGIHAASPFTNRYIDRLPNNQFRVNSEFYEL